jgi:hypothetical protein
MFIYLIHYFTYLLYNYLRNYANTNEIKCYCTHQLVKKTGKIF